MHVSTGKDTDKHDSIPRRAAYRVEEVAEMLGGLHLRHVYRLLERGELKSFKIGRRRMVPAEAIDEFIAKQSAA